jgi:putative transposase
VAYSLHAHLVFVTKYRRGVFDDAMLQRCEEIMREVCDSFETELREFNGEADHVHLLVHYPPKIALSKLINSLKGVSSRYLRAEYTSRINHIGMGSVLWSRSYFAGSCGGAPLSIIQQYIEGQQRPV